MKQRYVLVFAENIAEGNNYAKRAGLKRGYYRSVGHAASIRGIQVADVHILPGFEKRRDRHALMSEIRHGRDIVKLEVEMPELPEPPAVDQGDGMGQQLSIDDVLATKDDWAWDELKEAVTDAGLDPADIPEPEWGPAVPTATPDVGDLFGLGPMQPQGEPGDTVTIPITPPEPRDYVFTHPPVPNTFVEEFDKGGELPAPTTVVNSTEEPISVTPAPEPTRVRRSRCPECNELTFEKHDHTASVAQQRAAMFQDF